MHTSTESNCTESKSQLYLNYFFLINRDRRRRRRACKILLKMKNLYQEDWDYTDEEDVKGDDEKTTLKKKKNENPRHRVTRQSSDHLKVTADFKNDLRMEFDVKLSNKKK